MESRQAFVTNSNNRDYITSTTAMGNTNRVNRSANPEYWPQASTEPFAPSWLLEERDACGVGFIADQKGQASHKLVADALTALSCMEHRGGCCADQDSGDGAGVMTAMPWTVLQAWADDQGKGTLTAGEVGVGMVFLPNHEGAAKVARDVFEKVVIEAGVELLGFRSVPVAPETLGPLAREFQPLIEQVLVKVSGLDAETLERKLFLLRRGWEMAVRNLAQDADEAMAAALADFYVCSLSGQTIVYKGMVRSQILGEFYLDLKNPEYTSHFAVYHRRFSTNTLPKWPLAHPMRLLGHNGEINTLIGNINWMVARESELSHEVWGDDLAQLKPIVNVNASQPR